MSNLVVSGVMVSESGLSGLVSSGVSDLVAEPDLATGSDLAVEQDSQVSVLDDVEVFSEDEEDEGSHDRFSHYVLKDPGTMITKPSVALCGKVWTPRKLDDKSSLCPKCKSIAETNGLL